MKKIINKFLFPTILVSLTAPTILSNHHSFNDKTNSIEVNSVKNNDQEKYLKDTQIEALSLFLKHYFEEDFLTHFQKKYLSNSQVILPDTMPVKSDIAKEFEDYIYQKHGIKIKFEITDEHKNSTLDEGHNIIEFNNICLLYADENWIDLYSHNNIHILLNDKELGRLYEEGKNEIHNLYQTRLTIESQHAWQNVFFL